jgi:uncharacterized protein
MAKVFLRALWWLFLLAFSDSVFAQMEVPGSGELNIPKVTRRVTDFTNTLSTAELDRLELDLARFEDSTSTQILVVMITTLAGESLEDFSLRTAELNQPGQKGRDNGILVLIVKNDRKIRIEVGYGLEGALPDGLAGQIIRREITPHFRSGDYFEGIRAGVQAIMLATRHEYKADKIQGENDPVAPIMFIILVFFVIFLVMRSVRRSGGLLSAAAWTVLSSGRRGGRSFSSFGSKSGGGFGGFSGGGGSFGGGGASGSW